MNATKVLLVAVCAGGPASQASKLVTSAQGRGWTVRLMPTPKACGFLPEEVALRSLDPQTHTKNPDAIIIAPATFNTINKLAKGISDNSVLDVLQPRIAKFPTVILPFVNKAYARRQPYIDSLRDLRKEGVSILEIQPHEEGMGDEEVDHFPWDAGLDKIDSLM